MKEWPALEIAEAGDTDFLLAELDDFSPTALDDLGGAVRVFFATDEARDAALRALDGRRFSVSAIEISDEDWAKRSQANLQPVTVGRIAIVPAPSGVEGPALQIVIVPSMGFGTGHHATTRLCLAALQTIDLRGKSVLDVGTGSGVLAIAARLLGAERALGIDNDADAIQSANENLALNPAAEHVTFTVMALEGVAAAGDLVKPAVRADVITANLTGALLVRSAPVLQKALAPGGRLILSGVLEAERDAVVESFPDSPPVWEEMQDGWWAGVLVNRA
jgi:ribosomal protein L11 methyltransferase